MNGQEMLPAAKTVVEISSIHFLNQLRMPNNNSTKLNRIKNDCTVYEIFASRSPDAIRSQALVAVMQTPTDTGAYLEDAGLSSSYAPVCC